MNQPGRKIPTPPRKRCNDSLGTGAMTLAEVALQIACCDLHICDIVLGVFVAFLHCFVDCDAFVEHDYRDEVFDLAIGLGGLV
jgi:hypothetical protein